MNSKKSSAKVSKSIKSKLADLGYDPDHEVAVAKFLWPNKRIHEHYYLLKLYKSIKHSKEIPFSTCTSHNQQIDIIDSCDTKQEHEDKEAFESITSNFVTYLCDHNIPGKYVLRCLKQEMPYHEIANAQAARGFWYIMKKFRSSHEKPDMPQLAKHKGVKERLYEMSLVE